MARQRATDLFRSQDSVGSYEKFIALAQCRCPIAALPVLHPSYYSIMHTLVQRLQMLAMFHRTFVPARRLQRFFPGCLVLLAYVLPVCHKNGPFLYHGLYRSFARKNSTKWNFQSFRAKRPSPVLIKHQNVKHTEFNVPSTSW